MMMGFYRHLSPYVREGSKTHSMREGDRWAVGMRADMYIEPRHTTPSELIWRAPVHKIEKAVIVRSPATWRAISYDSTRPMDCAFCGAQGLKVHTCSQGPVIVTIGGVRLADDEASQFLWRDGFRANGVAGAQAMALEHWAKPLKKSDFVELQLIHWLYQFRTDNRDLGSADVAQLDELCAQIARAGGWKL